MCRRGEVSGENKSKDSECSTEASEAAKRNVMSWTRESRQTAVHTGAGPGGVNAEENQL